MKSLAVLLVAIFSLGIVSCDTSKQPSAAPESAHQTPSEPVSTSSPVPVENWSYTEDTDEMSGKKMSWACTSAPEGAQLCLRKTGSQLESYVKFSSVEDGQFLCLEDDCSAKARFDNDPVITFGGVEAAGGKTTMLFIEPTSTLVSHLRKAKTLKLQPPIFEHSGEVLHFTVSGLKW
jgi:hypothetical protein